MPQTVAHLITGLEKGGAETMLYQVLKYSINAEIKYTVINMGKALQYYEKPISELGLDVINLDIKKHPVSAFFRLVGYLRSNKTEVLCCWMYHANFFGFIAAKLSGVKKLVWNIRHSDLTEKLNKKMTLRINKICAGWSKNVDCIAYNGEQARLVHEEIGYCKEKGKVLYNGVDTEIFSPVANAKAALKNELGISEDKRIVLSVSRYHPIKDIPTFLKAFFIVHQSNPQTVAVMCGKNIDKNNAELVGLCSRLGLNVGQDIFLLGLRNDIPLLMSACDLYVLHSAGEAFPNTLVQAMACEALCLTTDVGEARQIISDEAAVVETGNADKMSDAMKLFLSFDQAKQEVKKSASRKIVEEKYDIQNVVKHYESIYYAS